MNLTRKWSCWSHIWSVGNDIFLLPTKIVQQVTASHSIFSKCDALESKYLSRSLFCCYKIYHKPEQVGEIIIIFSPIHVDILDGVSIITA